LPDPNNLFDLQYPDFFYHSPIEWFKFLIQQPVLRELMLSAPTIELKDGEKCRYSKLKSSDWRWNE